MKTMIVAVWVLGLLFAGTTLAQVKGAPDSSKAAASSSVSAAPSSPSAQKTAVDMGPLPFSNEEANFYRKAWPIDKSHSLGALILFGAVVVTLLALIIRQMAKSGPRKPAEKQ